MRTVKKSYLLPMPMLSNKEERCTFFKGVVDLIKDGKFLIGNPEIYPSFSHPGHVAFNIIIGEEEHTCQCLSPRNEILKQGGLVDDEIVWDSACPLPSE